MMADRGSAPVAQLASLSEDEAWIVRGLRLWCSGEEGRERFWSEAGHRFGHEKGTRFVQLFSDVMHLTLQHARRPLVRHGLGCSCVGADEAVFAHLINLAACGEREDAMLIASLLTRADVAPILASLAQTLGLELRRMPAARESFADKTPSGRPARLH